MKIKKEFILLALIIIALCGYLYVKKANRINYTLPAIPAISKDSIVKIELHKGDQDIVLTKKDGTWQIAPGNYQADTLTVDRIIQAVTNFSLDTLISDASDALRYDLEKDKKIDVKVSGEKGPLFSFAIGKRASTFRQTFVMIDGDSRIFQTQGNLRPDFELGVQDLRNKKVFPSAKGSLTGLEIKENSKVLTLKRKVKGEGEKSENTPATPASGWTDDNGKDIPEAVMNEFFAPLTDLQCESYLDNKKKEDFENPLLTITLHADTGIHPETSPTLSIFEKENQKDNSFPAISSEQDSPFVLQKFKVDLLTKAIKELRGEKKDSQSDPDLQKTPERKE